jgi:flagellar protein FliO/FliZ
MIRKLVLSLALVTAAVYADSAHAKKVSKTPASAQAVPAAQAEPVEETSMNAKLVVDSNAASDAPAVTDAAAASTALPTAVDAAPGSESIPFDALAKKDVSKLPEAEIPVLTETKEKKEASSSGMGRVLITLGVLVVVLGAVAYGLKRLSARRNPKGVNTKIQILTQHSLGPKKSLMIVQVAGESLLVGVTDHNISMLKTLSLIDDELPESMPRNFDSALDEYADDLAPRGRGDGKSNRGEREDFAMRGLGEIRDTVSSRIKNMKNL